MNFTTIVQIFMVCCVGMVINFSFIPAILRMRKNKSSHDVSEGQYWMVLWGVTCWAFYGTYVINDIAVTISNTLASVLTLLTILTIYRYRR